MRKMRTLASGIDGDRSGIFSNIIIPVMIAEFSHHPKEACMPIWKRQAGGV